MATKSCEVEQFGLEMIFLFLKSKIASGFTSGTINGISGSYLYSDELSMTKHPALAARGACVFVASEPIAKRAISKKEKSKVSRSFIFNVFSPKLTSVPTDLRLAKASICSIGKLRSANIFNISRPTLPVAPTTAIL